MTPAHRFPLIRAARPFQDERIAIRVITRILCQKSLERSSWPKLNSCEAEILSSIAPEPIRTKSREYICALPLISNALSIIRRRSREHEANHCECRQLDQVLQRSTALTTPPDGFSTARKLIKSRSYLFNLG